MSQPMVVGSTPISCIYALVTQWSECGSYVISHFDENVCGILILLLFGVIFN